MSHEPYDPAGDTRSYPQQPPVERPYGAPLPGYEQPPPPEQPRRGGSGRGWMAAFFLLLAGVVAAAVVWFLVVDSEEAGELELSTTIVDFGDEDLGKRSAVQTVTLDNQSPEPVRIASLEIEGEHAGDFQITDETTCPTDRALSADAQCGIGLQFRPRAREERSAVLVIRLGEGQGPVRVDLRGTGVGEATVTLDASRLDLGTVLIGKSRTRRVTLTNTGNAPLQIQELVLDGRDAADFRIGRATDCPLEQRLPAEASCTIAVTFRPKEGGESRATLAIVHDAPGSPTGIDLRGTGRGQAALAVEPDALDFGVLEVGDSSGAQSVTVTNTGTASFVLATIALAGPAATEFAVTDTGTCSEELQLGTGASCTIDLVFAPGLDGERSAALEIATRGGLAARVDLVGAGEAPPTVPTNPAETETEPTA
jgi:hypothetical protein